MDTKKIITRAKSILLAPSAEWPVIAAETDTVAGLYVGYILALAALPALVRFVSLSLIGVSVPFLGAYRVGIGAGLTAAALSYVLSLVGVYAVALIVEALAPTFSAEKNRLQALKTVAYAYTASWVLSLVGIIPGLAVLAGLAGAAYSLYLLKSGLPITMKCPPEKALGYTAVTMIVAIVMAIVLNLVVGSMAGGLGINRALLGLTGR
ncbi:MAG TPA: Yip1 family protein [Steroidobacteraceae bacterium]